MNPILTQKIEAEVRSVESDVEAGAERLFDVAAVDIRTELPGLVAKMGVDTSDPQGVLHAAMVLVITLLKEYGPPEIREILAVAA